MPVEIKVYGDTAEQALEDLKKVMGALNAEGVNDDKIVGVAYVAQKPVTKDPLDGNVAREEALTLLRRHYEDTALRPHFKDILAKFGVKAFGEVPPEKGVSFLAEVTKILRQQGKVEA